MSKKFKHLNLSPHWQQYFSKYPDGYTIIENLIDWVSQVDNMTDNVNDWNEYLLEFVETFDNNLQTKVTETLTEWQNSGFLAVVISEALQWELDNYIATNEQDKIDLTTQLEQTNQKVNDLGINLRDYGVEDGDDITDELISLLDNSYKIVIPEGTYYWSKPIKTDKVVRIEGRGKEKTTLVYKPNTANDLAQNAFDISVPHDVITDRNNIAEIEELTFKDESNHSLSLMKVALLFPDTNNERWGARVHFHKTDFFGYKNTGLTVVAAYEATFSHMKFQSAESYNDGYHQTPVNVTTGLKLTGVGRNLSIMGNVILIKGCSFHRHKYGVDVINARGVNFEDTVFEHNWISVYLHSKNEAKWSTRNIQFDNCWFEDTGNAHPDYYVIDCFIDETTGKVDTTKERALFMSVTNTVFYAGLGKQGGFPATNTHVISGTTHSSGGATKSTFIRQWDSTEEMNDFPNNNGVITQIGGENNYFRGKVTGAGGFQKNLNSSVTHVEQVNYVYENLQLTSFDTDTDTHVLLVDLSKFKMPSLPSGNHLSSLFLNTQITLMLESNDGIELKVEMEYSGDPLTTTVSSNSSTRYHNYKTKYPDTKQFNMELVDSENQDRNNNLGVRLSREGSNLKFEFNVLGLKGGRIFFENKYIVYESAREM